MQPRKPSGLDDSSQNSSILSTLPLHSLSTTSPPSPSRKTPSSMTKLSTSMCVIISCDRKLTTAKLPCLTSLPTLNLLTLSPKGSATRSTTSLCWRWAYAMRTEGGCWTTVMQTVMQTVVYCPLMCYAYGLLLTRTKSTYRLITILAVYENGPGSSQDNPMFTFYFTL